MMQQQIALVVLVFFLLDMSVQNIHLHNYMMWSFS
uniref:Uncharacterized protein n=1 Tax=Arundo donax TaxID=35708 RepID=A0A0A9BFM1_ARUDO